MKKITKLLWAFMLLLGASTAQAQYMPKLSTDGGTQYEYYITVMNSDTRTFVTTVPNSGAAANCFGVSNNPSTTNNLAKFTVSQGEEGSYVIKSVDRNAALYYTISTGDAANSVRSLTEGDTEHAANTNWIISPKTANYAKGFSIGPKDNNAATNWNNHGGTLGMWGNQSSASICVFVPANLEAMNELYKAVKSDILPTLETNVTNLINSSNILDRIGGLPSSRKDAVVSAVVAAYSSETKFSEYTFTQACELSFFTPATALYTAIGNNLYLPTGYYYFKSLNTDNRPPYLFNDYFREANPKHHTLQAATLGTSNNYVWHITNNNDGTIAITNGEGTPVVRGNQGAGADGATSTNHSLTFSNFNLSYFNSPGGCHFTENLNASNGGYKLSDNTYFLTTWNGGAQHADNRWTFEPISVEGKTVYTVSITGIASNAAEVPYVTCGDDKALNGGFFIRESAITATDITAAALDNYESEVTVSGNEIQVVYTPLWNKMLQTAITGAQDVLNNTPAGIGIGYPTTEAKTTLQNQISAAQNVTMATEHDIIGLQTATQNFLDKVQLPADGSYVRIKNYNRDLGRDDYDPNRPTNNPGEGGYMSATNRRSNTAIGVQSTTLDDAGAIWKVEATDVTGTFRLYNLNLKKYLGKTDSGSNSKDVPVTDNEAEAGTYALVSTTAYPQFTLNCTNAEGNYHKQLHASGYGLMNYGTGLGQNGSSAWIVSEAAELTVNMHKASESDSESWASIYLPFNVAIPADANISANKGSINAEESELVLSAIGGNIIPAENGVILQGTDAGTTTLAITQEEAASADMTDNALTGTLLKKPLVADNTYYFLGVNNGEAGMFAPAASITQIPGNKAYLEESTATAAVQGFRFHASGEATGIEDTTLSGQEENGIYHDLSGRRVQHPRKGIYIVDNRKVILK